MLAKDASIFTNELNIKVAACYKTGYVYTGSDERVFVTIEEAVTCCLPVDEEFPSLCVPRGH
jgi:hypothetical protein